MSPTTYPVLLIYISLFIGAHTNPIPTTLLIQTEEIVEYVTETDSEIATSWHHGPRTGDSDAIIATEFGTTKPWQPDEAATTAVGETTDVVTEIIFEELVEQNKEIQTADLTHGTTEDGISSESENPIESTTESNQEIQKQNATVAPATSVLWQTDLVDDTYALTDVATEEIHDEIFQKETTSVAPATSVLWQTDLADEETHASTDVATEEIQNEITATVAAATSVLWQTELVDEETKELTDVTDQDIATATVAPDTTTKLWQPDTAEEEKQDFINVATHETATTVAPATTQVWQTELATELVEITATDDTTVSNNTATNVPQLATTKTTDAINIDVGIIINTQSGQDLGPGYEVVIDGNGGNGQNGDGNGQDNGQTANDNDNSYEGHYLTLNGGGGIPIHVYIHVRPRDTGNR